jgi:prolyl oligopeptidase
MPRLTSAPPSTHIQPVTEIHHGVTVTDPYRWLEDQESPATRRWLGQQRDYARAYLDHIDGREVIHQRVHAFLAVETYDTFEKVGNRYFFRKRLADQEQPAIYMRDGAEGKDELLVDPTERRQGTYIAVKPLRVSPDGRFLLYEVKEGGEHSGTFELLDVEARQVLPDVLRRGHLRGFVFAPDGGSFYYVHEALDAKWPACQAAYRHLLGTDFREDREVFSAGEGEKLRLSLVSDREHLGFLVHRFGRTTLTDFYLRSFEDAGPPERILADAKFSFHPLLVSGKVLAITDRDAPNLRIVELRPEENQGHDWVEIVPESDARINQWAVAGRRIFVSYIRGVRTSVSIFDFAGRKTGEMLVGSEETIRFSGGAAESDELFLEAESFEEPIGNFRHCAKTGKPALWTKRKVPFDSEDYRHEQVWYTSRDGTPIPMFLMGRRDVLAGGPHPTIMTSYGGYGVSMTPQFSVFVALLVERGCLFALPNIRGGAEFGARWHEAAKRRNRPNAYHDFLCAAEWLVNTGRSEPEKLAIFGGSNAGLLVCVAMIERPELFRAILSLAPLLDMLRFHLFDDAYVFRDEFGTADDPDDFRVLAAYSPYQRVREGVRYPATMIVSGDRDGTCNPLHARKMTARLQAANASEYPILLDYSPYRGHSPVLPLSDRIESLTDRIAFLCDQLELPKHKERV